MKLAKKMLAGVLALAIVAAFALTAFAAAPVVKMTATKYEKVGDEVTVNVTASGITGLESAGLVFTYDAEVLEFVSIADPENAVYDLAEGDKIEDGVATWALIFKRSATEDTGALATLTFKVKKDAESKVVVSYDSWDGTDMPENRGVMISKKAAPTTAAPTTVAPTTAAPTTAAPTTTNKIPQTGEAGVAAIAGVMALAAVAFVATRKKDEE